MFEIRGKANIAVCYAKSIEDEAMAQIRRMCDHEFSRGSKIRIMPDVHAGKGCTIGTTMTITDKVVPNIVGVDIGCGMYTVVLGKVDIGFEKLDEVCHVIPSGCNVWAFAHQAFDLTGLKCFDRLKNIDWLKNSLGTLGGGNHFIEVDEARDGTRYLVIHSGSRNLGKQVAEHYQMLAIEQCSGKKEILAKRNQIIDEYKMAGKSKEIQSALKALKAEKRSIPDDLCYLSGETLQDYLHDMVICQNFAKENREEIANAILSRTGLEALDAFHTVHNYIDADEMILRKGAIAAHENEHILIPINMRDGSILACGKGNPDWNYSAPHGAGRIMSRAKAKERITMEDFKEAMEGVYTTSVNPSTLDEAPMAYKSIEDIIDVIDASVDIIDVMKPIYNFKAADR